MMIIKSIKNAFNKIKSKKNAKNLIFLFTSCGKYNIIRKDFYFS
jgi:hypothetical protein